VLKASKHEAIFKIRFPLRVVVDDNVDRLQVYNRNVEPSNTNCPIAFFRPYGIVVLIYRKFSLFSMSKPITVLEVPPEGDLGGRTNLGGYSIGVPPLPIPNREVKPNNVDGTAERWESR
jgi:hypothetical protein